MYYAKARFYDADNRHFTAVDPILDPSQYDLRAYTKDPMQLVQYLYVKDNAINWIDPKGEFYVFPCHNVEKPDYYALPENPTEAVLETILGIIPEKGDAAALITKAIYGLGAVGGNSTHPIDSAIGFVANSYSTEIIEELNRKEYGKILGDSLNKSIGTAFSVISFYRNLESASSRLRNDQAAFQLLALAGIEATGYTVEEVEYKVQAAIDYANINSWFYTKTTHQTYSKNWVGGVEYQSYPSAFSNLMRLKTMADQGKSKSEIQLEIGSYWDQYRCGFADPFMTSVIHTNSVLNQFVAYETSEQMPGVDVVIRVQYLYDYLMTNYNEVLDYIKEDFTDYMGVMMDLYYESKKPIHQIPLTGLRKLPGGKIDAEKIWPHR